MNAAGDAVRAAAVALGRALRSAGMATGVEQDMLLCRALGEIDVRSRDQVYWAARSVFVGAPRASFLVLRVAPARAAAQLAAV